MLGSAVRTGPRPFYAFLSRWFVVFYFEVLHSAYHMYNLASVIHLRVQSLLSKLEELFEHVNGAAGTGGVTGSRLTASACGRMCLRAEGIYSYHSRVRHSNSMFERFWKVCGGGDGNCIILPHIADINKQTQR